MTQEIIPLPEGFSYDEDYELANSVIMNDGGSVGETTVDAQVSGSGQAKQEPIQEPTEQLKQQPTQSELPLPEGFSYEKEPVIKPLRKSDEFQPEELNFAQERPFTKEGLTDAYGDNLPFEPTDANILKLNHQYAQIKTTGSINKSPFDIAMDDEVSMVGALQPVTENLANLLAGVTPDVDYETGVDGTDFSRVELSFTNTLKEKMDLIDKEFGKGSAGQDNQGRLTYVNPTTGKQTVIDPPRFELGDFADLTSQLPEIALTIGAAVATSGMSATAMILADIAAFTAGALTREKIADVSDLNSETYEEIISRLGKEMMITVPLTLATGATAAWTLNRLNNPLFPGMTPESVEIIEELARLNARRVSEGLPPVRFLSSALNEHGMIARMEGILAKVPGSSWIYNRRQKIIDDALNHEVDTIMKHIPASFEDRLELANSIMATLKKTVNAEMDAVYSVNNVRWSSANTDITGVEAIKDGVGVAIEKFKLQADRQAASLSAKVGDDSFIPMDIGSPFKQEILSMLKALPKTKKDKAVNRQAEINLKKWLQMTDDITLAQFHNIRSDLGAIIGGDKDVIKGIKAGQASRLYAMLNKSMELVAKNPEVAVEKLTKGTDPVKFVKELFEFDKFYKEGHELFVSGGTNIAKIAKANEPWELVNLFLREGNVANIKNIMNVIPTDKWLKAQRAVKTTLFFNRTGTKRTPNEINKIVNGLGTDVVDAWLGAGWGKTLIDMSNSLKAIQNLPVKKIIKDHTDAGAFFLQLNGKKAEAILQAKEMMSPKDWLKVQQYHVSNLLEDSVKNGVLDGKALMKNMKAANTGDRALFNKAMLDGTDFEERLKDLAGLAIASQRAKTSTAGGLAAGMMQMAFLTGNIVSVGMLTATTWLAAKALTSVTASKWLTRQSMNDVTLGQIRAMTELTFRIADETDDERPSVREVKRLTQVNMSKAKKLLNP